LERFGIYAPFIKGLNIAEDAAVSFICPFLYEAQSYYAVKAPGRALLPNLARISVVVTRNHTFRTLLCLLSGGVKELDMRFGAEDQVENLGRLLERVQTVSPSIVDFKFRCPINIDLQSFTIVVTCLNDTLKSQSTTLRKATLNMSVISFSAPTTPVVFSALTHLELDAGPRIKSLPHHTSEEPRPRCTSLHFPLLRVLEGYFENTSDILALQSFIDSVGSELTEIVTSHDSDTTYGDAIETLTLANFLITAGHSCPNLRQLYVVNVHFTGDLSPESMDGILQPLYSCTSLEILIISTLDHEIDISWSLSEQDIIGMTRSWKNLEDLQIHGRIKLVEPSTDRRPKLGANAVELLVAGCHQLHTIRIAVDFATIDKNISDSVYSRWHHTLRSVNFSNSRVTDPMSVAFWLNDLCSWRSIRLPTTDPNTKRDKLWPVIKNYVRCLQKSRELAEADMRALRKEVDELRARLQGV
jgi:hypothetical protein